jgi:Zn-dependent protease with chaperone function
MSDTHPKTKRIMREIDPSSWEHPADRAALQAARKIPGFDAVLRAIFGLFGERAIRLIFQANAVRVNERQFPRIHERYVEVLQTMDCSTHYQLFVSQNPTVNAGAYGMDKPFIVLNSATVLLLDEDERTFILGHELGHILSGHVLYRTMTEILLLLASMGFPIVGLAARAVLMGLLEWQRKAELSCDRAGLLALQHPEAALRGFLKLAGGGHARETDLNEFLKQADEYRESGDVADIVFKFLNLLGTTHPFHVLRAAELRDWVERGDYDRILRGEYRRRGEAPPPWAADAAEAARSYKDDAAYVKEQLTEAVRKVRESFAQGFRNR